MNMDEHEEEANSVLSADIHVCIFPHLTEFLVIDVRDLQHPKLRVIQTSELVTPSYLEELQRDFNELLHAEGPPFMNLMMLPARLQSLLQQKGIANLVHLFGGIDADSERPRISLFLASGPVLNMEEEDLVNTMEAFFDGKLPSGFVGECNTEFRRLLQTEKAHISAKERDELRRAVLGESDQFFTLWQDQPGEGFSPS